MICDDKVKEYKEAIEHLWSVGINPKKASKELRWLAKTNRLTKDHLLAYIRYLKAKHDLIRCAVMYVTGEI